MRIEHGIIAQYTFADTSKDDMRFNIVSTGIVLIMDINDKHQLARISHELRNAARDAPRTLKITLVPPSKCKCNAFHLRETFLTYTDVVVEHPRAPSRVESK